MWKGWPKSSIEVIGFFERPNPLANDYYERLNEYPDKIRNISFCPVCLKITTRSMGCNYITHDCSKERGYYNKELYNKYKTSEGFISWCTICGRICKGHNHYRLGKADDKMPETILGGDPFEKDCRISSGGGGLLEKLARVTRLYEIALELEELKGKISENAAYESLIKGVWDAPFFAKEYRNKAMKNASSIRSYFYKWIPYKNKYTRFNEGAWKKALKKFSNIEMNISKIRIPPFNIEEDKPKIVHFENPEADAILGAESKDHIEFQHEGFDHKDSRITGESLINFIEGANSSRGLERFGYCYMQPLCKAHLYPEEIQAALEQLPEEGVIGKNRGLLEKYKKYFYEKFDITTRGGGFGEGPLTPLEMGVCVLPTRASKNSASRSKTRSKSKSSSKSRSTRKKSF